MKKTSTLIAAMLLTIILYAYPNRTTISITSNSKSSLRVLIDGNNYNAMRNALLVNNLNAGYHNIKVYQLVKPNQNNGLNNNYQLVYNATVLLKPNYHVDISINRFGKAFFDEQPVGSGYYDLDDEDCTNNNENNNWNNNQSNNWNNNQNNNQNSNWNNNQNNNWNNTNRVMNNQSFDRLKTSLKNEIFENTRINIAKQVIAMNYFSTGQVKDLLQLFLFENNKLEIAKYAFRYTVDKGDYYLLADAFIFSSNKDELMRFIQANR